jgi:hypothetical protein
MLSTCPECAARRVRALRLLQTLTATLSRINRKAHEPRVVRKAVLVRRANVAFLRNEMYADCPVCVVKQALLAAAGAVVKH